MEWIIGLVVLFALAALGDIPLKRSKHVPLSKMRPEFKSNDPEVPIGLEATDLRTFNREMAHNERLSAQNGAGFRDHIDGMVPRHKPRK